MRQWHTERLWANEKLQHILKQWSKAAMTFDVSNVNGHMTLVFWYKLRHSVSNHSVSGRVTQAPKARYHLPITNFHSRVELSLGSEVYCLWDKIKDLFYSYPLWLSPASSPSLTATKPAVLNLGFLKKRKYAIWKLPTHFQIFTFLMAWLQSILGFIKWDLYKGWEPLQYAYLMNYFRIFQPPTVFFYFFVFFKWASKISTWLFLNWKFCRMAPNLVFQQWHHFHAGIWQWCHY